MIECVMCRRSFDPETADDVCRRCSLFGGCRLLRCPHCGAEMPRTPRLIERLFGRGKAGQEDKHVRDSQ